MTMEVQQSLDKQTVLVMTDYHTWKYTYINMKTFQLMKIEIQ